MKFRIVVVSFVLFLFVSVAFAQTVLEKEKITKDDWDSVGDTKAKQAYYDSLTATQKGQLIGKFDPQTGLDSGLSDIFGKEVNGFGGSGKSFTVDEQGILRDTDGTHIFDTTKLRDSKLIKGLEYNVGSMTADGKQDDFLTIKTNDGDELFVTVGFEVSETQDGKFEVQGIAADGKEFTTTVTPGISDEQGLTYVKKDGIAIISFSGESPHITLEKGGETYDLTPLSQGNGDGYVYIDFLDDGRKNMYGHVDVKGNGKEYSLDITNPNGLVEGKEESILVNKGETTLTPFSDGKGLSVARDGRVFSVPEVADVTVDSNENGEFMIRNNDNGDVFKNADPKLQELLNLDEGNREHSILVDNLKPTLAEAFPDPEHSILTNRFDGSNTKKPTLAEAFPDPEHSIVVPSSDSNSDTRVIPNVKALMEQYPDAYKNGQHSIVVPQKTLQDFQTQEHSIVVPPTSDSTSTNNPVGQSTLGIARVGTYSAGINSGSGISVFGGRVYGTSSTLSSGPFSTTVRPFNYKYTPKYLYEPLKYDRPIIIRPRDIIKAREQQRNYQNSLL